MGILVDTSFLLASSYAKDSNHPIAHQAIQNLDEASVILPVPVLQELFYMTTVRIHYARAIDIYERMQLAKFQIQPLNAQDMRRMVAIMRQYKDVEFDYTDVAIMALSERLNITQVYTFDQRDFRIFRPAHCPHLELLP
jgi:predicted nucleic acid-binding protein